MEPLVKWLSWQSLVELAVLDMAFLKATLGQSRVGSELKRHSYLISLAARSIRLRHESEACKKAIKAFEAKVTRDDGVLVENRLTLSAPIQTHAHGFGRRPNYHQLPRIFHEYHLCAQTGL